MKDQFVVTQRHAVLQEAQKAWQILNRQTFKHVMFFFKENICRRDFLWSSNPGGDEIFRTLSDRPWGPPSLPYHGNRVFITGLEPPGGGVNQQCLSISEVKERIELYFYSPLWALMAYTTAKFTFR
jgi:hypothetical protein